MNKKQILEQIRSEIEGEKQELQCMRDADFFAALAKNKNLTRAEFNTKNSAFDKGVAARSKAEVMRRYTKKLIETSGFKSTAPNDFKKAKPPTPEHAKIYTALAQYCAKFPAVKTPNVMLCGATGTGKTYTAHIVANNLLHRGFSVLYVTSFGLVERFKKYVQTFGDETETDALFDCDMLVIDDLGTEPIIKNITQEYLYNVINERLVSGKAFLITTNLSPAALMEKYDQRIASRILSKESSVVIEMRSKDLRLS